MYALLETSELERVVPYAHPHQFARAVTQLCWLAGELNALLAHESIPWTVDVIKVCYLGCYPCLGVRGSRNAIKENSWRPSNRSLIFW